MAEHNSVQTLRAVLQAFNSNDMEAVTKGLHSDVKYVIRGRSQVSGTFTSLKEMAKALQRVRDRTGDTMRAEPEVLLSGGDHVILYARLTASRPDGRRFDSYEAVVFRFRDGRLVEGDSIPVDQYAFDEFFED